jgi:RNA polymerase sigma-70 factor (ECF subfamily)
VESVRDQAHRRALEALYLEHERGLVNAAYRYVWNTDDARDVVHDAFVRLWNKRDRVEWPRAAGLAYATVLGIARNRRRGDAVRRAFGLRGTIEPHAASPDLALDEAHRDAAVRRAIDALPERLRSVLVMCLYSDLDYTAIGAALGIPAGTVGSRRTEAVAILKEAVDA